MKKPVIRKFTVKRSMGVDRFTKEGLADVYLANSDLAEKIEGVPYRITENDITIVCRAVMNSEHKWNFPWWQFGRRQRIRDFREYYKWGTRI